MTIGGSGSQPDDRADGVKGISRSRPQWIDQAFITAWLAASVTVFHLAQTWDVPPDSLEHPGRAWIAAVTVLALAGAQVLVTIVLAGSGLGAWGRLLILGATLVASAVTWLIGQATLLGGDGLAYGYAVTATVVLVAWELRLLTAASTASGVRRWWVWAVGLMFVGALAGLLGWVARGGFRSEYASQYANWSLHAVVVSVAALASSSRLRRSKGL